MGRVNGGYCFCYIWPLFHRVKRKIFISYEWQSHTWYIHIFHLTSEIKVIFNKKHLNFLFIIYKPFRRRGTIHFFNTSYLSFLALSLGTEHDSISNKKNNNNKKYICFSKMFSIQLIFWCYKIIQHHKSSDLIWDWWLANWRGVQNK